MKKLKEELNRVREMKIKELNEAKDYKSIQKASADFNRIMRVTNILKDMGCGEEQNISTSKQEK